MPKGKYGRGRYVFIWIADKIEILSKNKKVTLNHTIQIENDSVIDKVKGTEIHFDGIYQNLSDSLLSEKSLHKELLFEFGWFLMANNKYELFVNNNKLALSENVKDKRTLLKKDFPNEINQQLDDDFEVRIIIWNEKPSEFSKFYFLNRKQIEIFKQNTGLNKKSDDFWHSVYISSSLFENATSTEVMKEDDLILDFENKRTKRIQ
ncbi:MAG: hypothetical protein WCS34_08930, partial [Bacteroidales bacterium]